MEHQCRSQVFPFPVRLYILIVMRGLERVPGAGDYWLGITTATQTLLRHSLMDQENMDIFDGKGW